MSETIFDSNDSLKNCECTKELSISDVTYLSKFNTEEEIDNEISRLYELISRTIPILTETIDYYKNTYIYDDNSYSGKKIIEIDLSIIDKYNLKELSSNYEENPLSLSYRITHIYRTLKQGYNEKNIELMVYRIYRHRKGLEKKYKKILNDLNEELGTNFDETIDETKVKEKLILLHQKIIKLIS